MTYELCGDHVFFFTTQRHRSQLVSPQTLFTPLSVSSTCMTQLFPPGDICFLTVFANFCICRVLDESSTPQLTRGVSSRGSPAVFPHRLLLAFYGHYTRRPGGESPQRLQGLTWTFAFTHAPPLEIIRRNMALAAHNISLQ